MPPQPIAFDSSSLGATAQNLQPTISPAVTLNPAELFAKLQATLEQARAEYAVRRFERAHTLLEDIQSRLPNSNLTASFSGGLNDFALLEASLHTLRGRLTRESDQSFAAFQQAVALFSKYAAALPETPGVFSRITSLFVPNPDQARILNVRIYTDYGIALFRTFRNDEAIRVLNAVCKSGAAPVEALAYLGYAAMNRKEYAASESWLRTALQLSPSNPTISYRLGHVLRLQGKKDEAASAFCEAGITAGNLHDYRSAGRYCLWALRLKPTSESALHVAAMAYRLSERSGLALLVIDRYIKDQPTNVNAFALRGLLLRDCNRVEESIQVLRAIEVRTPTEAWILGELVQSLLLSNLGGSDEAAAASKHAVELSPDDSFLLHVRARVLIQRGEFAEAVKDLRRVDSMTPGLEVLAIELGNALLGLNDIEAALEHWLKAASEYPRSAEVQFGLGLCYQERGMYHEAVAHYRRSSRLDPANFAPLIRLLSLLIEHGLKDEAMEEIEDHISGPVSYIALWQRGVLLAQSNQWQATLDSLFAAATAARQADVLKNWPEILLDLGNVLRQVGRYEEARQIYDEALEIGRDRADVLSALARCLCDLAEFRKAEEIVNKAIGIAAEDSSLWSLKGWCLQHLGASKEARVAYETAVALSERKDPWSLKGLANVLMDFDPVEARRIFTEVLEKQKYQPNAEQIKGRPSLNSSLLGLLGWCNYRLGRYEEAIRLYQTSTSQTEKDVPDFFDLGLTLLATDRVKLARQAYKNGFSISQQSEAARLRGQYFIALFDLVDAVKHRVIGSEAEPIINELTERLSSTGIDVSQLAWLAQHTH